MLSGTMTVGVVQAFFQYINQAAEPLTEASFMVNSLQSALASAKRTFELLDEEEEIPDPAVPLALERAKGEIAFVTRSIERYVHALWFYGFEELDSVFIEKEPVSEKRNDAERAPDGKAYLLESWMKKGFTAC